MPVSGLESAEGVWSLFPTPAFLRMPALGVDLSDRSVKFIRLSREKDRIIPTAHGKYTIEEGVLEKGRVLDRERLVTVLKEMREATPLRDIYLSLPEEHGYLFQTDVDWDLTPSQTRSFVEFNLKENVPLAPEQAVFDYSLVPNQEKSHTISPFRTAPKEPVIEDRKEEAEEEEKVETEEKEEAQENVVTTEDLINATHEDKEVTTEEEPESVPTQIHHKGSGENLRTISVSVYPREIVEEYIAAFEEAGFSVLGFEIEAQSTTRAVIPADDNGTYMIVDLGRTNAGLTVVNRGVVVFTSTLEVGGDNLNNAIQKYFDVSPEEAQKMKDEKGFLQGEENKEVVAALFSTLSVLKDEIKKHCSFWESQTDMDDEFDSVERIYLCGGNANLLGLPEYLEANIGVPVQRADAWVNVLESFDDVMPPISRAQSLEYTTAIGLALQYARK